MIDLRLLRDNFDTVAAALGRRGVQRDDLEALADLERRRRELVGRVDTLRATQRDASEAIRGAAAGDRDELIARASASKADVQAAEAALATAETALADALAAVPNLPDPDAPVGVEGEGAIVRTFGARPEFDFTPRDHVDLLEAAGALDLQSAARLSGSRFAYLKADAVLLELALVRYALDIAAEAGHVAVIPPVLVRREAMFATGFLPTDEQQIFATRDDDLYLVGTAEVSLAGLHADEIVDAQRLPLRYAGFSTCFRREAGTYGKDVRGIFRVHQFDKVELFSFVDPSTSRTEHERILDIQERIVGGLGLHYQVVDIPTGDLGASAARKFDIEAWLAPQAAYRELTSCSNTTDYQARRLRCRLRTEAGTEPLHTLNGTAVAVGRTIIALVETHQRADGSVAVPAALVPYVGRDLLFTA